MEAERKLLGRGDSALTSRTGYAGGKETDKEGRVSHSIGLAYINSICIDSILTILFTDMNINTVWFLCIEHQLKNLHTIFLQFFYTRLTITNKKYLQTIYRFVITTLWALLIMVNMDMVKLLE